MKEAPAVRPALPGSTSVALIAAVDVDVADVAAVIDVAPEGQVGAAVGVVAERAIGADAIGAVSIVGHPATAREAADPHAATSRLARRDRYNPSVRAGGDAHERTDDSGEAGSIRESVLDR